MIGAGDGVEGGTQCVCDVDPGFDGDGLVVVAMDGQCGAGDVFAQRKDVVGCWIVELFLEPGCIDAEVLFGACTLGDGVAGVEHCDL